MDQTAIQQINNQATAKALNEQLKSTGFIAVPNDHNITDTDLLCGTRRFFEGSYQTDSLTSFKAYCNDNKQPGSELFIDKQFMRAESIIDLYKDNDTPAIGNHKATFRAEATPEYAAIKKLCESIFSQKHLAEFAEEWGDTFNFIDSNNETIELKKAINAIRTMSVNQTSSSENTVSDMSASKSRTAHIEAKGREITVAGFTGNIKFYNDLSPQDVTVKLSIHTNGDDIKLSARALNIDRIKETLANELCSEIENDVEIKTYIGEFSRRLP